MKPFLNKTLSAIANKRERQFAQFLTTRGESWQYHSRDFSFGTPPETYTPDFVVPRNHAVYEVIGSRQALHQSHEKIARFLKAFPNVKFYLVRPDGENIPYSVVNNRLIYTTPTGQRSHLKTNGNYAKPDFRCKTLPCPAEDHEYVKTFARTAGYSLWAVVHQAIDLHRKQQKKT